MDIKKFGCLVEIRKEEAMPWLNERFQVTELPVCSGCQISCLVKVRELGGDGFIYLPQVPEGEPYSTISLDKFKTMILAEWMTAK